MQNLETFWFSKAEMRETTGQGTWGLSIIGAMIHYILFILPFRKELPLTTCLTRTTKKGFCKSEM